jgi:hypothetical protein
MKKLFFSIAALAAIVVMGSCSKDSSLNNQTEKSVGSVTVSLNVNSGIDVSESSSSLNNQTAKSETSTRAGISTRADGTAGVNNPTTNFAPTYPTSYTAYFVAKGDQNGYKGGEIVRVVTIDNATAPTKDNPNVVTNTKITVPALDYNIIVTNYTPTTNAPTAGGTWSDFETSLPTSSTTLYLYGQKENNLSSSTTTVVTANVTLDNNYAAVCVAHNNFVTSVKYNVDNKLYTDGGSGEWYYLYVRANSASGFGDASNTNSALTIQHITGVESYTLKETIAAGNIYQYTINDNFTGTGGNENGLAISVTPFKDAGTKDLSVYPQQ